MVSICLKTKNKRLLHTQPQPRLQPPERKVFYKKVSLLHGGLVCPMCVDKSVLLFAIVHRNRQHLRFHLYPHTIFLPSLSLQKPAYQKGIYVITEFLYYFSSNLFLVFKSQ